MADESSNDGKTTPTVNTKTTKDATDATKKYTAETERLNRAYRAQVDAMEDWAEGQEDLEEHQKKLSMVLKEQIKEILNEAKAIGTLRSQIQDVGQATTAWMRKLKEQMSITNRYNFILQQGRDVQKAYAGSLLMSTKSLGKATAESDRRIMSMRRSWEEARRVAIDYGVASEEVTELAKELELTFIDQIAASQELGKATNELVRESFVFARAMGVDSKEAVELLGEIMNTTTDSLEDARHELVAIEKAADDWTNSLKSLGAKAMETGNVTRKGFLNILKEVRQEFKSGIFAMKEFANATNVILKAGKIAGLSSSEQAALAKGFGGAAAKLSSAESVFGLKAAQRMVTLYRTGQIKDKKLYDRLDKTFGEDIKRGDEDILLWKGIAEAGAGSAEQLFETFKVMKDMAGGQGKTLQVMLMSQGMSAYQAKIMSTKYDELTKTFETSSEASSHDQLEGFKKEFEKVTQQGAKTEDNQLKIAMAVDKMQKQVEAFIEKYWIYLAAALAGASLFKMVGGGGSLLARLGIGAAGTTLPGAVAGAGATGAGATGAGVAGSAAIAGGGTAAAGALTTALGAGAIVLIGGPVAAYTGHKVTQKIFRAVASEETKYKLGKGVGTKVLGMELWGGKAGLGDYIGDRLAKSILKTGLFGKQAKEGAEMLENVTRIRGVIGENHKKTYEQNKVIIQNGRDNWDKLTAAQQDQILALEQWQKDFETLSTKSDAEGKKSREDMTNKLSNALIKEGFEEMNKQLKGAPPKTAAELEKAVSEMIFGAASKGSTRSLIFNTGDTTKMVEAVMASPAAAKLMEGGMTEDQIRKVLTKQLIEARFDPKTLNWKKAHLFGGDKASLEASTADAIEARLKDKSNLGAFSSEQLEASRKYLEAVRMQQLKSVAADQGVKLEVVAGGGGGGEIKEVEVDASGVFTFPGQKVRMNKVRSRFNSENQRNRPAKQ